MGLSPGTTSYFENMVIDYSSARFPLGPGAPTNASVTFGGAAATNVTVVDSTTITATTPAHLPGSVSVTVTNPDGQSGTLANGFAYTAASAANGPVLPPNANGATATADDGLMATAVLSVSRIWGAVTTAFKRAL